MFQSKDLPKTLRGSPHSVAARPGSWGRSQGIPRRTRGWEAMGTSPQPALLGPGEARERQLPLSGSHAHGLLGAALPR
jgi:hypothetical protein